MLGETGQLSIAPSSYNKLAYDPQKDGAGTPGHFGAYMFGEAVKLKPEPVHYKTTADALGRRPSARPRARRSSRTPAFA